MRHLSSVHALGRTVTISEKAHRIFYESPTPELDVGKSQISGNVQVSGIGNGLQEGLLPIIKYTLETRTIIVERRTFALAAYDLDRLHLMCGAYRATKKMMIASTDRLVVEGRRTSCIGCSFPITTNNSDWHF